MRPLTNNERKYAVVLGVLLTLCLNLFSFQFYLSKQRLLKSEIIKNTALLNEANTQLAQEAFWTERQTWLTTTQPTYPNVSEATKAFKDLLESKTQEHKLSVTNGSIMVQPNEKPPTALNEARVHIEFSGSLESIVRWFADIQQPTRFIAISGLSLKTEGDTSNMICHFDAIHWFKLQTSP